MDSRQVYRDMDVGTDKVSRAAQEAVPHHGLDLIDPAERFSAEIQLVTADGSPAPLVRSITTGYQSGINTTVLVRIPGAAVAQR